MEPVEITEAMLDDWEVGTRAFVEDVREPSVRRRMEEDLALFALARKGLEAERST